MTITVSVSASTAILTDSITERLATLRNRLLMPYGAAPVNSGWCINDLSRISVGVAEAFTPAGSWYFLAYEASLR